MFGRAYGLALPASLGRHRGGSLIAAPLVRRDRPRRRAAVVCGCGMAVAYGAALLRGTGRRTPAPRAGPVSRDGESVLVA